MDDLMSKLITKAKERYGVVMPCFDKENLNECFTVYGSHLILWFNTMNQSTCTMSCSIYELNEMT